MPSRPWKWHRLSAFSEIPSFAGRLLRTLCQDFERHTHDIGLFEQWKLMGRTSSCIVLMVWLVDCESGMIYPTLRNGIPKPERCTSDRSSGRWKTPKLISCYGIIQTWRVDVSQEVLTRTGRFSSMLRIYGGSPDLAVVITVTLPLFFGLFRLSPFFFLQK